MNPEVNDIHCGNVQLAIMAALDGEEPPLATESVAAHVSICEACRMAAERLQMTATTFRRQVRVAHQIDVWPLIRDKLAKDPPRPNTWLVIAFGLVVAKLVDSFLPETAGRIYMIIPLILTAALFISMRENPFRISTDLRVEEQT